MATLSLTRHLDTLRQTLREVEDQAVLVTDTIGEGDAAFLAFRTVVQLDGDIVTTIHPAALDRPDFEAAHTRHLAHVSSLLSNKLKLLRRWSTAPGYAFAGLTASAMYGSGSWFDLAVLIVDVAYAQVATVAVALVGGLAASSFGRVVIRIVARQAKRRALEMPGDDDDDDD